jgi:hypothetical protein
MYVNYIKIGKLFFFYSVYTKKIRYQRQRESLVAFFLYEILAALLNIKVFIVELARRILLRNIHYR